MMYCHDCSKDLYWKHDPVWENRHDSAYFSPGVLDKYIRCLRCWKLALDEKGIPYTDEIDEHKQLLKRSKELREQANRLMVEMDEVADAIEKMEQRADENSNSCEPASH